MLSIYLHTYNIHGYDDNNNMKWFEWNGFEIVSVAGFECMYDDMTTKLVLQLPKNQQLLHIAVAQLMGQPFPFTLLLRFPAAFYCKFKNDLILNNL